MSQENVEIVRANLGAWRDGTPDMDVYLSHFHPQLVYHPRADEPDPSPHIGRDAYAGLLQGFVDSFSEVRMEVLELIEADDLVIAPTVLHGRLRESSAEVRDTYVFVSRHREGLIVECWEYRTKGEALEAVGLSKTFTPTPETET
jgi:ketosteroid isomerase-like protein